jgi:DNA-binding response OmpR family regulator
MRILLVEDHDESREVLARLMRHWGFEVATAPGLAPALEKLATPFDAVISDISLPDGSGYAVACEAKRLDRKTLAVALTGHNTPADVETGRIAGFDHYLSKPFNCEEIRTILARHGRRGSES